MNIIARDWIVFTLDEKLAILEYAAWENSKRWKKKKEQPQKTTA